MFGKLDLKDILGTINLNHKYKFIIKKREKREKIQGKMKAIIDQYHLSHVHEEYIRAIGNAVKHGTCPVKCTMYIGKNKQVIIIIHDSGLGFDYKDIVHKFKHGQNISIIESVEQKVMHIMIICWLIGQTKVVNLFFIINEFYN